MKKSNFIEIVSLVGLVSIILFSSTTLYGQNKLGDESSAKLSKRIEKLETLVKEQQKQIESLQNEIEKIKKESPIVTLPSYPNSLEEFSNKMPNGAKPFRFNGQTYYMVPLNKLNLDQEKLNMDK